METFSEERRAMFFHNGFLRNLDLVTGPVWIHPLKTLVGFDTPQGHISSAAQRSETAQRPVAQTFPSIQTKKEGE
jgi:hypothetical protein